MTLRRSELIRNALVIAAVFRTVTRLRDR
jgi:hypothetical protein